MTQPPRSGTQLRRAVLSSYLGSVIEYYDFLLYATASAVVFNRVFFSDLDPLVGTVASFGTLATINYLDKDAQPQRVDDTPLPWSTTLTTTDPTLFADLRAQGDAQPIGCRITVNGIVKDERSTDNVNGYIACLDKSA